ncbi:hypothetical protein G9A89_020981 [Geosiphon pyriformis]|nr:hypothetical protein G9A89_020981 [Geosiphon pyriformis]
MQSEQNRRVLLKEWPEILDEFLLKIGLAETSRALRTEMIAFPSRKEEEMPKYIDWLLQGFDFWKSKIAEADSTASEPSKIIGKRKKEIEEGDKPVKRIERIDAQQVQIRATHSEIVQRIEEFAQFKKSEINNSNRAEFLRKSQDPNDNESSSCARTEAAEINRNIQMKLEIVNNEDGPLARSTFNLSCQQNYANSVDSNQNISDLPIGVEERLSNIQDHLNLRIISPIPLNVYERLRVLEDKIMELERDYPPWAALHFNQPNRQGPLSPPVTTIVFDENYKTSYLENNPSDKLTSGNSSLSAALISSSSKSDAKSTSKLEIIKQQSDSKSGLSSMQLKGRANSSLTRSIIQQLEQVKAKSSFVTNI